MAGESDLLRQQRLDLLALIRERGTNPANIFAGIVIMPDTSAQELVDTTARVVEELMKRMKGETNESNG